jgi:hypothetical protein
MRALILASALALAPVAAWAQTATTFQPGPPTYDSSGHLLTGIAAAPLNAAFAGKADFPLSTVASGGLNPLPVGSPLFNWGQGFPTSNGANVTDPGALYINNGGVNVYKDRAYGTEDRSCGGSFVINGLAASQTNMHCGSDGGITETPSHQAAFTGFDSVALFASNTSKAPLSTDPTGTFDATDYFPSAGHVLNTAQLAQMRVGMTIRVGSTVGAGSSWNGIITGWASNGTSVQVSGWFTPGNANTGQVPTNGKITYVSVQSGVFAANFTTEWNPTLNPLATDAIGSEIDVYNDSGVASTISTPFAKGQEISCTFNVSPATCGFGDWIFGGWAVDYYAEDASFAGFVYAPSSSANGAGFYSSQVGGNVLEENNPTLGVTVAISPTGSANFSGNVGMANLTVTGVANFVQNNEGNVNFSGAVNAGVLNGSGMNISGSVLLSGAIGTPPGGACVDTGQIEFDTTNIYVCAGGAWRQAALTNH